MELNDDQRSKIIRTLVAKMRRPRTLGVDVYWDGHLHGQYQGILIGLGEIGVDKDEIENLEREAEYMYVDQLEANESESL